MIMIITSHIQKIIQIYPCLLKLSHKQKSVTDGQTDGCYYNIPHHYCGGIIKRESNQECFKCGGIIKRESNQECFKLSVDTR